MNLEKILEQLGKPFQKGGKLEKLYPLFEAGDTFAMTPGKTTKKAPFVRDAIDIKRVMIFVVLALIPATLMGIFNVGYQAQMAQGEAFNLLNAVGYGLLKVLPIIIVTYAVGGFWEVIFAVTRKHEINEGFLVTGILFALTLPPTIPLWQVAAGISFGVVIGKEIFGGTGFNVLNPALTARAFVFFAYPAQLSGDKVWMAVDGVTKATPLGIAAVAERGSSTIAAIQQAGYSWGDMFWGFIPGSIGETSTFACLLGLVFLLITRIASWRVIAG